jgi:hypothetical protein
MVLTASGGNSFLAVCVFVSEQPLKRKSAVADRDRSIFFVI